LAFVVGQQAYQVAEADAESYIAGYSVMNDYTMRDYQYRTLQWDQGKTFEKTSGFGPFLTTTDSYTFGGMLETKLEGEVVQTTTTDDLVFTPAKLVDYISHIVTHHRHPRRCRARPQARSVHPGRADCRGHHRRPRHRGEQDDRQVGAEWPCAFPSWTCPNG
jgi:hypothetical protein